MINAPSLKKSRIAQAVTGPLDLRAPLPKEVSEEVRAEVEEPIRSSANHSLPEPATASDGTQASEIRPDQIIGLADPDLEIFIVAEAETPPLDLSQLPADLMAAVEPYILIPAHWSKGALLNVRNRGDHYCITLYPEEFDPRHPERALTFPNTWTCQDFVSKWYFRENPDPRAR